MTRTSRPVRLFLLAALAASLLGRPGRAVLGAEKPSGATGEGAAVGYYHPDAPGLFPTLETYLAWYSGRSAGPGAHRYDGTHPTLGLHVHESSVRRKNLATVDAIVREVEGRGANAVVFASRASPAWHEVFAHRGRPAIDVLMFTDHTMHLGDREKGIASVRQLGVPIVGALHQHGVDAARFDTSPTGFHPELTPFVVDAEREGRFEPIVVSAKATGGDGASRSAPIPGQVAWRVERALSWARLRRLPNSEKRVVFTFWSEGGGKANAGGDPDDFLDVPGSLVKLFAALRAEGYDLGPGPLPGRDELSRRISLEATNVGIWAPGELSSRAARHEIALIPEKTYLGWYSRLPAARRAEIEEMWGPPPGEVMVHLDASGRRFLAIPTLTFGKIRLCPHPDWGYLQSRKALMSKGALPPHHQYVAFFLWLQNEEGRADAWVSLFSNIVLQPGKAEGPAATDHVALLLGPTPHIHPERLGASGGPSNKRKGMARLPGWYNLVTPYEFDQGLGALRAAIRRYEAEQDSGLRAEAERLIRRDIAASGIARALTVEPASEPFPSLLDAVRARFDELERSTMPHGSRILGEAPDGDVLTSMVAGMLGPEARKALAAHSASPPDDVRRVVAKLLGRGGTPEQALAALLGPAAASAAPAFRRTSDYASRLREAPREITAILEALAGRWIDPGPMDEPMRDPDAVPPGRVLYNFDQAALPTQEAEAVGIRQAEALIASHREKHGGAFPSQLAFVVWSSEIARTHGVTEAQILHLLGTRAVRDERGAVTGVALIPREELGRPRVDVLLTISGVYRDHYLDKVELVSEAVRLAASSPEPDNPVAARTAREKERLEAAGEGSENADKLSRARVFSEAPSAYSPSIQFLAKSGDERGDEKKMAELYTGRVGHAYGGGLYGVPAVSTFQSSLRQVDAATFPRSSNVNGMLDNPMPAAYLGGLNLAAKALTGRDVDLYVSNLRDKERPSMDSAAGTIQSELRARYFNPKWIAEMMKHGYDGARNLMFLSDHLDLWDSTATRMVTSADWAEVKSVLVDDSFRLGLDAFFDRHNPHAQQVLLGNLLGAASRGHWEASAADLAQVAGRLARSAVAHGAVCEAAICRNSALTRQVREALSGVPGGVALAADYAASIAKVADLPAAPPMPATDPAPTAPQGLAPPAMGSTPAHPPAVAAPPLPAPAPPPPPAAAAAPTGSTEAPQQISGQVLEEVARHADEQKLVAPADRVPGITALVLAMLFLLGWFRARPV